MASSTFLLVTSRATLTHCKGRAALYRSTLGAQQRDLAFWHKRGTGVSRVKELNALYPCLNVNGSVITPKADGGTFAFPTAQHVVRVKFKALSHFIVLIMFAERLHADRAYGVGSVIRVKMDNFMVIPVVKAVVQESRSNNKLSVCCRHTKAPFWSLVPASTWF